MNTTGVRPTAGCTCATCAYLRGLEAPLKPAPHPWQIVPRSPFEEGWVCACGQRIYSMQVHTCPYQGVIFTHIAP